MFSAPVPVADDTLAGQIFEPDNTTPVTSGAAVALGWDTLFKKLTFADIDTSLSGTGNYELHVPEGEYLVLAVADSQQYPGLSATYHQGAMRWHNADKVQSSAYNIDITMQQRPMDTSGMGWIKGFVYGTERYNSGNKKKTKGDPLANINCVLIDKNGNEPKQSESTDSVGIFLFTGVPEGKYHVHADVAGIPVDSTGLNNFKVDSQTTHYDSVEVVVDSTQISVASVDTSGSDMGSDIKNPKHNWDFVDIYPNPASDKSYLYINNPAGASDQIRIELRTITGHQLFVSEKVTLHSGFNKIPIDLAGLSEGPLLVNVWYTKKSELVLTKKLFHLK
jgi:hypothetical protein